MLSCIVIHRCYFHLATRARFNFYSNEKRPTVMKITRLVINGFLFNIRVNVSTILLNYFYNF